MIRVARTGIASVDAGREVVQTVVGAEGKRGLAGWVLGSHAFGEVFIDQFVDFIFEGLTPLHEEVASCGLVQKTELVELVVKQVVVIEVEIRKLVGGITRHVNVYCVADIGILETEIPLVGDGMNHEHALFDSRDVGDIEFRHFDEFRLLRKEVHRQDQKQQCSAKKLVEESHGSGI